MYIIQDRTGDFYSARLTLLRLMDDVYGTKVFCVGEDGLLLQEIGVNHESLDESTPRLDSARFDSSYDEIEEFLSMNLACVNGYIEHLDSQFSALVNAGIRYDSIYKSELSDHRRVNDHDFYFKKSVEIDLNTTPIPTDYEGKLVTFLVAIKNRNKRANIAVKNIGDSCGEYFKHVELIVVEDYSSDPFLNKTGYEIKHLITNNYNPSNVWNKSALLNKGLDVATTKYVVMSDCDFLYRDLKKIVEVAYEYRVVDNLMFHVPLHETHETTFLQTGKELTRPKFYPYSYVWIFNRDSVLEINGFNESFVGWGYEETDLIRRVLSQECTLALLSNNRAYHLSHGDSTRVRVGSNRQLFDQNILKPERTRPLVFDQLDDKTEILLATYNDLRGGSIDILGNGPSLKAYDFHSESVKIGFNVAYRYWCRVDVYPEIYICMDKVVCAYHAPQIRNLIDSGRIKFFILDDVFLQIFEEYRSRDNIITFSTFKNRFKLFETNHITTGSFGARLAVLLGFRHLNIWGMSGEYVNFIEESERISLSDSGLPIDSIFTSSKVTGDILRIKQTPKVNPNYFFDDYQVEGDLYNIPSSPKVFRCSCNFHGGKLVDASIHKYWYDLFLHDLRNLGVEVTISRDGVRYI